MSQNFIVCDREQELLLPPSLREWLPEGHLAWFVLAAVQEMDLSGFYGAYRLDGHGRPAHEPGMMVALLLYAYAKGQRSSRVIERECVEDIAYRVIAANQVPDHTTVARFRQRHEDALAGLFGDVLGLCAEAGLTSVGVIAIDGTKVHANASRHSNRDYEQIAREILAEADAVDREEDERFGEARGDELPEHLSTEQGRRGWLREAKRRLEEQRAEEAAPIPRSRPARLREAKRRLEQELDVECRANEAYEAYRARGVAADGRPLGRRPKPYRPPETPAGKVNVTDPDSRNIKSPRGYVQGYNAQAVTNERQIVIAAEVSADSPDFGHLEPMVTAAQDELDRVGVTETPQVVVADAGYWHQAQIENVINRGMQVLIPPDALKRGGARPGWDGGAYAFMRRVLETDHGGGLYRKRQGMIEPVFADTKFNRRIDRFQRRGRSACRSEWRLITATHNLLKLHRHQTVPAGA
ncbi:MAG TPA: transposase [Thermoleophilaceae bacterium]|nr:transposase [Thermoleophilaceae bacterium]